MNIKEARDQLFFIIKIIQKKIHHLVTVDIKTNALNSSTFHVQVQGECIVFR